MSKLKVVLISHPKGNKLGKPDFPPPGIAFLGAIAKRDGHEYRLIDGGLKTNTQIISEVKSFSPDVIGITCWTIGRADVWDLAEGLRKVVPDVPLLVGGPHATEYPSHIFKKTHAQVVVKGEGEKAFSELLKAFKNKEDIRKVKGLILRDDSLNGTPTPLGGFMDEIDDIPMPNYEGFSDFSFDNYNGFPSLPLPTATIISSRGCVFDCTFCSSVSFWGKTWRYRSPENVLSEIKVLVEKYNVKSLYFFDDNFPVNKERAAAICQGIIDNKWDLQWACCSHVKMLNEPLVKLMSESGCRTIDFGVESGSEIILKNIRKKQTTKAIKKTFALCHKYDILPRAYLMVGNEGENENTIDETISLIKEIKPYSSIGANILWLLPGTDAYRDAERKGIIDENYWLENDDIPYNTTEHSFKELVVLRDRLLHGVAKSKGGLQSYLVYQMKRVYYKFPQLSFLRDYAHKSLPQYRDTYDKKEIKVTPPGVPSQEKIYTRSDTKQLRF